MRSERRGVMMMMVNDLWQWTFCVAVVYNEDDDGKWFIKW